MDWHTSLPYTVPLLLAAVLTSVATAVVWRHRSAPGAGAIMLMGAAAAQWSLTYALELSAVGSPAALVWARLQYAGIMALPVAFLLFTLHYTNRSHLVTRASVAALCAVPLLAQALVWTNDLHRLVWTSITLDTSGPIPLLVYGHGPGFWAINIFAHLCLLASTVLLIGSFRRTARPYLLQIVIFVLGAAAPWIGNAIYVLHLSPWPGLDLTPFAFSWTVAALVINVTWLRFLSLVPIARASVMERMPGGLIVLDELNRVVDLNAAARRRLGLNGSSPIGQPVETIMGRWPQLVERYRTALRASDTLTIDVDGDEPLWLNVDITPLYDAQQSVRGRLIIWNDVTEIKRAEAALRQRNEDLIALQQEHLLAREAAEAASRAKSSFLANMSHELRTPLTAIMGYADLISLELEQRGLREIDDDLTAIRSAGSHLLGLITQVLDLSRIEANKMELRPTCVQLADLLDDVARTVRPLVAHHGNAFVVEGAETAGEMVADETKMRQVLLNLLSNAAKFTHHGTIRLSVRREHAPPGEQVVFAVADTGMGIEPDYLPQLFEPFTQADVSMTRREGGAGLGLAISRQFCMLMGGELTVTSAPGAGSTFVMRLPATPPGAA